MANPNRMEDYGYARGTSPTYSDGQTVYGRPIPHPESVESEPYYHANEELPDAIQRCLTPYAQEIYRTTFNQAWSDIGAVYTSDCTDIRYKLANCKAWTEVERSIDITYPLC